jgi:hypothetical protein
MPSKLDELSDEELDAAHMDVQARRAAAELAFKAEAKAIQDERDRRALAAALAAVPDELKAAIRAEKGK